MSQLLQSESPLERKLHLLGSNYTLYSLDTVQSRSRSQSVNQLPADKQGLGERLAGWLAGSTFGCHWS